MIKKTITEFAKSEMTKIFKRSFTLHEIRTVFENKNYFKNIFLTERTGNESLELAKTQLKDQLTKVKNPLKNPIVRKRRAIRTNVPNPKSPKLPNRKDSKIHLQLLNPRASILRKIQHSPNKFNSKRKSGFEAQGQQAEFAVQKGRQIHGFEN